MPPTLITLIMNIISSTRFHILWNRTPLSKVVPNQGVRQGNPLSPYLFVLCLERLSHKLEEVVRCKLLHPIKFRARIRLSHLFFADDIFLFTKATTRDCKNLCQILQKFCDSSAQLMSVTKSRLWFSPSTPSRIKEQVAGIFAIPTTDRIGTYLRTPIFTSRRTAQSYQYLVDNIRSRIEGLQAKYINGWSSHPHKSLCDFHPNLRHANHAPSSKN